MTGQEFAEILLDESDYQFLACLNGVSEENFNTKAISQMMSMRECVEHMIDCCIASQRLAAGEKYEWGSFHMPDASMLDLIERYKRERVKAAHIALDHLESKPSFAKDFLIAHEFYHVGQLSTLRSSLDPDWDMHSIYRF